MKAKTISVANFRQIQVAEAGCIVTELQFIKKNKVASFRKLHVVEAGSFVTESQMIVEEISGENFRIYFSYLGSFWVRGLADFTEAQRPC